LICAAVLAAVAPLLIAWIDELRGRVVHPPLAGDFALLELSVRRALHFKQLLGPYSRFGWAHPGPLYFYWIAPFYALKHHASDALFLAAATLSLVSVVATIAIGSRVLVKPTHRALGLVALSIAVRAFVTDAFETGPASPWNPAVSVLPFVLLVTLAAHVARPRARGVAALFVLHAFLSQTHVGNAPVATAVVFTALLLRRSWRAVGIGALTAAIVWSPLLIDAMRNPPGNIATLVASFRKPTELHPFLHAVGYATRRIVGLHLASLSIRNGLNLLIPIELALIFAATRRRREGRTLAVIAAALLPACFLAATRIDGDFLPHLSPTYSVVLPIAVLALVVVLLPDFERPRRRVVVAAAALVLLAALAPTTLRTIRKQSEDRARVVDETLDVLDIAARVRSTVARGGIRFTAVGPESWAVLAGVALALEKDGVSVAIDPHLDYLFHGSVRLDNDAARTLVIDTTYGRNYVVIGSYRSCMLGLLRQNPTVGRARVIGGSKTHGALSLVVDGVDARGTPFDAPTSVVLEPLGSITVVLDEPSAPGVRVFADGNDVYGVETSADGIEFHDVGIATGPAGFGIQPRDLYAPLDSFVRVSPVSGDGLYAIAEIAPIRGLVAIDEIRFGTAGARARLVSGWSGDEGSPGREFVWAVGGEARCLLRIPARAMYRIAIDADGASTEQAAQTVTVKTSGVTLGTFPLHGTTVEVVLPPELAHPSTELTLSFAHTVTPKRVDPSSKDARPLAAAFRSIRVMPDALLE
jgi:hypothetical protein